MQVQGLPDVSGHLGHVWTDPCRLTHCINQLGNRPAAPYAVFMLKLRCFSDNLEQYAKAWRQAVEWHSIAPPGADWKMLGKPGDLEGSTASVRFETGDLTAVAKPTHGNLGYPEAAHEKIAADLGFDLGLPTAPVILWDRHAHSSGLYRYCALSLIAFNPANKWLVVHKLIAARERLIPRLTNAASAMTVFDTWLDNKDRHSSTSNLVVNEIDDSDLVEYAYIDHGQTLSYSWRDGPAPGIGTKVAPLPQEVVLDAATIADTIAAIEALTDEHIHAVVDRIPDEFINLKRKVCIREGLCVRRESIRASFIPQSGDAT